MINRRHIRVKVMQSVYAMHQSNGDDIAKQESFLQHSIRKMLDLYVLNLHMLVKTQELAAKRLALAKNKILATEQELKPNMKFVNNKLIKIFAESVSLDGYLELNHLNQWEFNDEYVKLILDELQQKQFYKDYLALPEESVNADREFVITFFKEIIAPNEKLADFFEDTMISWTDDIPFVNTWVVKTLTKQSFKKPFILGSLYKDDDDKAFVKSLFTKTVLHQHSYDDDIKSKTPNWDTDRIAEIDLILIKLALTEFLYFPSIPSRVTINEYIELAKDYSTNKSGFFINGILDKLSKEYEENGKMVKIGRGLI